MKASITPNQYIQYAPLVAEKLLGKPNPHHSKPGELRYGSNGSLKVNLEDGDWYHFEDQVGGGVLDLIIREGEASTKAEAAEKLIEWGIHVPDIQPSAPVKPRQVAAYDYTDEHGELLFQVVRFEPKTFRQRRPKGKGWEYKVTGTRQVPYRLPQLLQQPDAPVFIVEGEKDADALAARGLVATCNAGGAGKWNDALTAHFAGRDVVILPDNDDAGEKHLAFVAEKLQGVARSIRAVRLPGLPEKGDVSDWLSADNDADDLLTMAETAPVYSAEPEKAGDRANMPEHRRVVHELNDTHALVIVGDKPVILRETIGPRHGKELVYLTKEGFSTWYRNQRVAIESEGKDGQRVIKMHRISELWLDSPERRQYEGITFAPANNAPASYYNLWAGYSVKPLNVGLAAAAMKCRKLLSHMKYVLCNGNKHYFRYLLGWSADMLQDPDRKKGVALVMRGLKGTGKSTFTDLLSALLGRHAMKVAHMRHLTGNFNRHLADKLLVVAEESYWAGDKADEGPLKDMITSDRITIEAKGIDAVEMPSLCRIAMITNNEWAAPASTDERRYFVLDVNDRRKQDYAYFAAIHDQMESNCNEGLRALLTLLLKFPLDKVNLRKAPETEGLRHQRALSLEPHDQFIYDALVGGTILGQEWSGIVDAPKDDLYDAYIDAARKRGKSHLLSKEQFGKKVMAATGAIPARPRKGYDRVQVYRLPAWEIAAKNFAERCGVDVERCEYDDEKPF